VIIRGGYFSGRKGKGATLIRQFGKERFLGCGKGGENRDFIGFLVSSQEKVFS
jgi:hypothetical protein